MDRCKHIFKLSQGEYVAPERVESIYSASPLILQVFVDGSPLSTHTVAVIVPEPTAITLALRKHYGEPNKCWTMPEMCSDPVSKAIIMADMKRLESDLKGFEKVSNVLFVPYFNKCPVDSSA